MKLTRHFWWRQRESTLEKHLYPTDSIRLQVLQDFPCIEKINKNEITKTNSISRIVKKIFQIFFLIHVK